MRERNGLSPLWFKSFSRKYGRFVEGPTLPQSLKDGPMAKNQKLLDDLFHDTLKEIYFAEKKILATLPKMQKAAQSEELAAAYEKHHDETEGHVERLEKVFEIIDEKPQGKTLRCDSGNYQ